MWPADSLEKTLMLGETEGRRRRGWQKMRWLDDIIGSMDMSLSKLREIVKDREAWHAAIHGVTKGWTWLSDWTTATVFHQTNIPHLLYPVLDQRHLGCFQVLTFALRTLRVCVSFQIRVFSGDMPRIEIARSYSNSVFSLLRNFLFIHFFSGNCHRNFYWFPSASPIRLWAPYKKGQTLPALEFTFLSTVPGTPSINTCSTEMLQIILWKKDWYINRFNSKSWIQQNWILLFHFLPSIASYSLLTWRCNSCFLKSSTWLDGTGVNNVLFNLLFIWLITMFRNSGPVTKCHSRKREVSLLLVYNSVALLGPTGVLINKPNLNYFCKSDFRRPEDPEQRPGHNLKAVKPDILSCYLNQHSNA